MISIRVSLYYHVPSPKYS